MHDSRLMVEFWEATQEQIVRLSQKNISNQYQNEINIQVLIETFRIPLGEVVFEGNGRDRIQGGSELKSRKFLEKCYE